MTMAVRGDVQSEDEDFELDLCYLRQLKKSRLALLFPFLEVNVNLPNRPKTRARPLASGLPVVYNCSI